MASSLASTSKQTLSNSLGQISSRALNISSRRSIETRRQASTSSPQIQALGKEGNLDKSFHHEKRLRALRSQVIDHFVDSGGSSQTRKTSFRPHQARINPVEARNLTVSHLLASTAHMGHSISNLSRASIPFLHGTRHGQAIIDVEKYTIPALKQACKIVKDVVYRDGVIVFLGTAKGTERCILQAAQRLGKHGFHVTKERWIPGVLTNASKMLTLAVLGDIDQYEEQFNDNKRYNNNSEVDATALATKHLLPDLMIVFNPKENSYAIREATSKGIPTIGVIDTDVDPRIVTYAIPANDESIRTTELIAGVLSKAGEEGMVLRKLKLDELDRKRRKEYAIRKHQEEQNRKAQAYDDRKDEDDSNMN